ncbi:MAG: sugar phosphate nucleotidyltransferase [Acidobacteriota bacterium]
MGAENFGLIMAGGQGTRFWPYSTEKKPKQFLNIVGNESLIKQTFDRLKKFIKPENIFIVADKKYLELTLKSIPGFNKNNFIEEPSPRNTAPCLILSNIVLSRKNSEGNILVVPADHFIPDQETFAEEMTDALSMAEKKFILTSGIKPYIAHTGYGYIKFNRDNSSVSGNTTFFSVEEFREKPGLKEAKAYMNAGNYFWNSGMFIYKLKYFKEFLKEYSSEYYDFYTELEKNYENKEKFKNIFNSVRPESIDYALMEKVKEVKMFGAGFEWNDVGAWLSVYELNEKDENNNVNNRDNILIDSKNSLLFSTEDKPIALLGLENVAVINTDNGILVASMDELQKVKEVISKLKKK